MDDELADRVLLAAASVPSGRVASYGDLAELVGTGPRQVGRVLACYGHSVAWWRIVNARGCLPPQLLAEAYGYWRAEGTPVRADGSGCRISACRAEPEELGRRYAAALEQDDRVPEAAGSAATPGETRLS